MNFTYTRTYRGPLQGLVLDWAGTTVDFGSFAPVAVFTRLFEMHGVPISVEQARAPMGLMKKDHLRAIAHMPDVDHRWRAVHGTPCSEADFEAMFGEFIPMQIACLSEYGEPIPGAVEAVSEFRRMGLKIGSTTGYTREMMEVLVPEAEKRGYCPDAWACPSDVPAGRPHPWMCYLNAIRLQIYPMEAMVKVGDTILDIEEGLNAGMWTIGITMSGNGLGLTCSEMSALSPRELKSRRETLTAEMLRAGAHYTADSIVEVPPLLEKIERRLANGSRP